MTRYRETSQHANTDSGYASDGAHYPKLRLRFWYEDQYCNGVFVQTVMRLQTGGVVPVTDPASMFHQGAYTGIPIEQSGIQIVWPAGWLRHDDGRGYAVLEMDAWTARRAA